MRVVITGGTGFIGQNLIPLLFQRIPDVEVLMISRNVEKSEFLYPHFIYSNCKQVHTSQLDEVIKFNPELVIHLATLTTSNDNTDLIPSMLSANIEFGVLLLDALSKCSDFKLFVNTGTFAEFRYGAQLYDAAYLYGATKTAFRIFLKYYAEKYNFKYVTAVPYSVYGGKKTVKRVIDYIYESLGAVRPIGMTEGKQILDFIHVDDVANFFVQIILNPISFYDKVTNGLDFHLGTGKGTSIRELAKIIEKKYGKSCNINWGALPYRDRDIMYAVAPIGRNRIIDWKKY